MTANIKREWQKKRRKRNPTKTKQWSWGLIDTLQSPYRQETGEVCSKLPACDVLGGGKNENRTENSFGTWPVWHEESKCTLEMALEGCWSTLVNYGT